ncbi:MAG TPA: SurA N-terminal domain-containing protein [Usitatibacter sp.]|nr:SurA N-terminal domain-containing protein [Usitatibacter sp.]
MEKLRAVAQNKVFKILFALFLIVPFGLFGVEQYLQRPASGDAVARVGKQEIGSVEFDQAVRKQADTYRQQFGRNFDPSIMDNPEIRRGVLDQLVNERLIDIGSQRAGVKVPDRVLADRIAGEQFFQVDGKFSRERYEQLAKAQGLTPVGLDERLRTDFRQQQFRNSIAATAFVPKSTLDSFIRLSEQTRSVSVINLTPDAYMDKVKVTPEQVKAYYDANHKEFTTPEQVRVEYLELSMDALAAKAEAPAEEVKRVYEDGIRNNRWGSPEERRASHILLAVKPDAPEADRKAAEAKAQAIAEQLRKKPDSFSEVAKKESQDPGSAAQGGDLGFFPRGAMTKAFEDAAFAAKKGEILGPVLTEFGFHVIRVTDVKPAKMKTLAEATPEIEAEIKKAAAQRKYAEAAEAFSNLVYEQSSSLKPAADALKLTVQTSPWISKGMPSVPVLANPKIQAEIFSDNTIKAKRNTSAVEVQPNVLVSARVIEHKPAQLQPFEAVSAGIERKLKREEALKLAKADGEAKLKEALAGKEGELKWPAPLDVNRQKPGGLFPQVLDRAFRADPKKLPAIMGVETPMGYSLVKVTKVTMPEKIEDAKRQALGGQLQQAVAMQELEATLSSLRNDVGVSVRTGALEPKDPNAAPQPQQAPPPQPRGKF